MDELASPSYVPLDGGLIYDKTENNIKVEDGRKIISNLKYISDKKLIYDATNNLIYADTPLSNSSTLRRLETWTTVANSHNFVSNENEYEAYTFPFYTNSTLNSIIKNARSQIRYIFLPFYNDGEDIIATAMSYSTDDGNFNVLVECRLYSRGLITVQIVNGIRLLDTVYYT